MDILNFISWIKGKRNVTSVDPASTVLPVGLRDPRRDDQYIAGAITVQDFAAQMPAGPTGAQGPAGPQGVAGPVGPAGLNWQGSWSASGTYVVDDAVGYGGASWFCIDPVGPSVTTPDLDPTNWALLASQGSPGVAGPQGIQGVPGPNSITVGTTTIASGATERLVFQSGTVVNQDARLRYITSRGSLISTGRLNNVQNTAVGDFALSATTTGLYNTGVGYQALRNLSSGSSNVAIGNTAAVGITSGGGNVAIGHNTLSSAPSNSSGLTAVGNNTLVNGADLSTAFGSNVLSFTTGGNNTAFGHTAGSNVTTGISNTIVGCLAGFGTTTGNDNVFIGMTAGYTGNFNSTCVIGQGSATANNQMVIGAIGSEFGTVAAQVNTSTKYWEVTINGVVEKILLA
jgi:hypothetical protein